MTRRALTAVVTAVVACAALTQRSCTDQARHEPRFQDAPVIIISIDTLRADHLPAYGYRAVETPSIDRFASEAILYRHTYSHSPMTLPSHLSMLSGLLPAEHKVRNNIGYRFDASASPYLPCILRDHGYTTGAAVSSYVMRAQSGIDACFDTYEDSIDPRSDMQATEFQRSGDATLALAEPWIRENAHGRFFFLFHIYEPHVPYTPPEPFRSRFASPYDGEIAAADAVVGRFLTLLRSVEVFDRSIIVLTSDHGEGLGDHGEEQHSILLYREAIEVPLLIKLPRSVRGGTTEHSLARRIGLPPTVLGLLGIEPSPPLPGRSLIAADARDHPQDDRLVFSETMYPRIHLGWNDLSSLVSDRHHYIHGPKPELYDLLEDPAERRDLIDVKPEVAARMVRAIRPLQVPLAPLDDVDPEAAARLEALGYVGRPQSNLSADLPNPRDRIGLLAEIRRGLLLGRNRKYDEGIAVLRDVVQNHPDMTEAWYQLAGMLSAAGRFEESAAAYNEFLIRAPILSGDILVEAGFIELRLGRTDEAEALAQQAMHDTPAKAHELLARVALARGRLAEAEAEARSAVDPDQPLPSSLLVLAEVIQRRGNLQQALETLDRAERRARQLGGEPVYSLEHLRGDTLARMNRPEEAIRSFRREIELFPHNTQSYAALAVIHLIRREPAEVDRVLEEMVRANPHRHAYLLAAQTLEAVGATGAAGSWRRRAEQIGD